MSDQICHVWMPYLIVCGLSEFSEVPSGYWFIFIFDIFKHFVRWLLIFLLPLMLLSHVSSLFCFKIWVREEIKIFTSIRSNRQSVLVLWIDASRFTIANFDHALIKLLDSIVVLLDLLFAPINHLEHLSAFCTCQKTRFRCLSWHLLMFFKNLYFVRISLCISLFLFDSQFSCSNSLFCQQSVIFSFIALPVDYLEAFLWLVDWLFLRVLSCRFRRFLGLHSRWICHWALRKNKL